MSAASRGRYLAFCSAVAQRSSALLQMVFCTSTITPAEGSTAESSSTARMAWKKRAALPAVLFGDLDPHQAHLEELLDDVLAEDAGFVHLADVGPDLARARTCARWPGRTARLR